MVFVLMTFIGKKYDFLLGDSVKNISRNTIYLRLIVFICCKKKNPFLLSAMPTIHHTAGCFSQKFI